MNLTRTTFATGITAILFMAGAHATTFDQLVAEESELAFAYEQMGVGMEGHFRDFSADLSFDPDNVEEAKASFEVKLGSVDLGAPDFDAELQKPDWFDTPEYPVATFVSESIKSLGDGNYHVKGTLGIKGIEQPLEFDAEFAEDGDKGRFSGVFTLERGAFNIGEGTWSSFDVVANDVQVQFNLVATGQ